MSALPEPPAALSASFRAGRLVLLVPHLYVTLLGLTARSEVPFLFGRWSKFLAVFNAMNLVALAAFVMASLRGRYRAALPALFVMLGLSYFGAMNNDILHAPLALGVLAGSRIGFASLLILLAFEATRPVRAADVMSSTPHSSAAWSRRVLVAGVSVLALSVFDAAAVGVLFTRQAPSGTFFFRSPVDLAKIEPNAVVFVGDSFVWGQGVQEQQAFANRIGAALRPSTTPVYNLGQIGAGLGQYLEVSERLPARDTTVLCYFMNDMIPREWPLLRVREALLAIGQTSFVARLLSDLVGLRMYPDADEYTRAVIGDYDKRDPTFPARWRQTEEYIGRIAVQAKRDARHGPVMVILPVMWEFSEYPLREAHADLTAVGRREGFEVVDMLPVFSRAFPHGKDYTVGPNDDHFNAEVHAKVAEVLEAVLQAHAGGDRGDRGRESEP
jgi:hypothetical protein